MKWTENQGNSSESESWFWLLEDLGVKEIPKINKKWMCIYNIHPLFQKEDSSCGHNESEADTDLNN